MPKRELRIVKRSPRPMIGVCEACNMQLISHIAHEDKAEWEVKVLFGRHKCESMDSSQNALRIVREATENR